MLPQPRRRTCMLRALYGCLRGTPSYTGDKSASDDEELSGGSPLKWGREEEAAFFEGTPVSLQPIPVGSVDSAASAALQPSTPPTATLLKSTRWLAADVAPADELAERSPCPPEHSASLEAASQASPPCSDPQDFLSMPDMFTAMLQPSPQPVEWQPAAWHPAACDAAMQSQQAASGASPPSPPQISDCNDKAATRRVDGPSEAVGAGPATVRGSAHRRWGVGRIKLQLDDVILYGEGLLMGKYRLLGDPERRVGSTRVVLPATNLQGTEASARCKGCRPPYVVQFYRDTRCFDREMWAYNDPRLSSALAPLVEVVANEDARVRDPFGRLLPPFVVTDYGVRLDEWAFGQPRQRVAEALAHVATAVARLHAVGLVHGSLRPSCILWMPRLRAWVVTDYTAAERAGARVTQSAPNVSIVYEAPELVQARLGKRDPCPAHTAADVYALALIAWELLTGEQLFTLDKRNNMRVIRALLGGASLPWEADSRDPGNARLQLLGGMRDSVLAMLDRTPARRPSIWRVCDAWGRGVQTCAADSRDLWYEE